MMIDLGDLQLPPEFFNKQSQDDHKKLMLLLTKVSGMRYLDVCRILNKKPELDWCDHVKRSDLIAALEKEFEMTYPNKEPEEPMTFFNMSCAIRDTRKSSKKQPVL